VSQEVQNELLILLTTIIIIISIFVQHHEVVPSEALGPGSVLVVSESTRESLREEVSLRHRFKRGYRVTVNNCL